MIKKAIISGLLLLGQTATFSLQAESFVAGVDFTQCVPASDGNGCYPRAVPQPESTTIISRGAHDASTLLSYLPAYDYIRAHRMTRNANGDGDFKISFIKDASVVGPIALNIVHSSETPVKITVNGHVIEENYIPGVGYWIVDDWEITPYLVDGVNTIWIETQGDYIRRKNIVTRWYYISSLKVLEVDAPFGRNQSEKVIPPPKSRLLE